jgi:hypothetical protein
MIQQTSAQVASSQQAGTSNTAPVTTSLVSTNSSLTVAQQQENLVTGLQKLLARQHGQLKPYQIHAIRTREIKIRKQLGIASK